MPSVLAVKSFSAVFLSKWVVLLDVAFFREDEADQLAGIWVRRIGNINDKGIFRLMLVVPEIRLYLCAESRKLI